MQVTELGDFAEVVPVSAVSGEQVDLLADVMARHLPESPQLYPDGMLTDEPEHVLIAELIREAALEGVRDELPHSIAVLVEEIMPPRSGPHEVFADIYVERSSQKAIVIGRGRQPAQGRRHHARGPRSRTCSAPGSTSTCTFGSPRTGSVTRGSSANSGSERPV